MCKLKLREKSIACFQLFDKTTRTTKYKLINIIGWFYACRNSINYWCISEEPFSIFFKGWIFWGSWKWFQSTPRPIFPPRQSSSLERTTRFRGETPLFDETQLKHCYFKAFAIFPLPKACKWTFTYEFVLTVYATTCTLAPIWKSYGILFKRLRPWFHEQSLNFVHFVGSCRWKICYFEIGVWSCSHSFAGRQRRTPWIGAFHDIYADDAQLYFHTSVLSKLNTLVFCQQTGWVNVICGKIHVKQQAWFVEQKP